MPAAGQKKTSRLFGRPQLLTGHCLQTSLGNAMGLTPPQQLKLLLAFYMVKAILCINS
jgi:hypothetical protein